MKSGFLNSYFKGVAAKRLAEVEVNAMVSNQHEFNVNKSLIRLFGKPSGKVHFKARFLYLNDIEEENKEAAGILTWYDARANHPTRSEYRLYFPSNDVLAASKAGDSMFICLTADDSILLMIADSSSTIESQLYYLFDLVPVNGRRFEDRISFDDSGNRVEIVVKTVLEKIGIEYEADDTKRLYENLIDRFGGEFPGTEEFSRYARETVTDVDPVADPDDALIRWYDRETTFFKMMEKHIIEKRLKEGFVAGDDVDVEGFIKFSLSVQNRRKSRAGLALENGIEEVLTRNGILFKRTPVTENRNKPDFLFPGDEQYHDPAFPAKLLTMLGAKTTSKDRWRQVLEEADRIEKKHLITLEGAISRQQTDQMQARQLQLVVPASIQPTYTQEQQNWLMSVCDFIGVVRERQTYAKQHGLIHGAGIFYGYEGSEISMVAEAPVKYGKK